MAAAAPPPIVKGSCDGDEGFSRMYAVAADNATVHATIDTRMGSDSAICAFQVAA